MNFLRINLTKHVYVYTKNYKIGPREMKGNLNKWKVHHVLELEDSILLRCYFSPQILYRFRVIPILSAQTFCRICQADAK